MENLFKIEKLHKPNFLQRLFGFPPKINALLEINNLLASKSLKEIKSLEIEEISKKYHVDLRKRFKEQLRELYLKYLRSSISDIEISDQEMIHLNYLRKILCLDEQETEELRDKVVGEIYTNNVDKVVSDGKIEKSEIDHLDNLQKNLRLSSTSEELISTKSRQDFLQEKLNMIIADERVSPDEWEELLNFAKNLDVNMVLDDLTKDKIEKMKLYWQIEHGDLPEIPVGINLLKNENCYFSANADWLENRTVTRRINYEGPTARIKIVKGLYYRAGSIGVQRMTTEELQTIDSGKLYLTTKRIIFDGNKKNSNIPFNKILSVTPYIGNVEIEKDSGRSPIFRLDDAELFTLIINRLVTEFQNK